MSEHDRNCAVANGSPESTCQTCLGVCPDRPKFANADRVRPKIKVLVARGNVTQAEVAELRCNSWEWEALVPAMDDDAFVAHVEHAIKHCSMTRRPAATYGDAIVGVHAPELLRRLKGAIGTVDHLRGERDRVTQDSIGHLNTVRNYEQEYILPCFKWATEAGLDLRKAISKNAGHNCVEILIKWLMSKSKEYSEVIDGVREALGQDGTHYLVVADDVKAIVEAVKIDGGCRARRVLRQIQAEPGSGVLIAANAVGNGGGEAQRPQRDKPGENRLVILESPLAGDGEVMVCACHSDVIAADCPEHGAAGTQLERADAIRAKFAALIPEIDRLSRELSIVLDEAQNDPAADGTIIATQFNQLTSIQKGASKLVLALMFNTRTR